MSDTARDYQTIKLASTEGMDALFESESPTGADTQRSVPTNADTIQWVSVTKAGALLSKSERTIQRYIKSGKLIAKDDITGKLLVGLQKSADILELVPTENECLPTGADSQEDLPTSADIAGNVPNMGQQGLVPAIEVTKHLELIRDLQNQLQAASFRNGYLESQLENQREQIKLLTDSQHKGGWWARFSSWFFGRG